MTKDSQLLKDVLSVPTFTYKEDLMVEFLIKFFNQNNIEHFVDEHKNVYATKQTLTELPEDFYFPCVISHTDTVHRIDTINIKEEMLPNAQKEIKLSYKAYNDEGNPTGIGGDDKCGVFACLSLLKELPNLKAAFFVAEETGCNGSLKANKNFFKNVGYGIQFDAPENWMITEECFGQVLFDRDTEFFESCDKVLTEGMIKEDPFSIGYYNYHTKNEYVVVEDVFNGADMGRRMIESLGNKLHYKKSVQNRYGRI
jgi:di/tripeptidase